MSQEVKTVHMPLKQEKSHFSLNAILCFVITSKQTAGQIYAASLYGLHKSLTPSQDKACAASHLLAAEKVKKKMIANDHKL